MSSETNDEQNQANPAPPSDLSEAPEAAPAPSYVILVVEDEPLTRKAVGRMLQSAGYEVVLVPTAVDALIVAQRMIFHVMVLDLGLPDPSDPFSGIYEGFSMLDWLHRQVGDFKFRIIVHTTQRSMHVLQRADEHGVFAVCNKRRDLANLMQCVAQAIDSLKIAA